MADAQMFYARVKLDQGVTVSAAVDSEDVPELILCVFAVDKGDARRLPRAARDMAAQLSGAAADLDDVIDEWDFDKEVTDGD